MSEYLLTSEAKEVAKRLVEASRSNKLNQSFWLVENIGGGRTISTTIIQPSGKSVSVKGLTKSVLEELTQAGLIAYNQRRYNLLQELHDAVGADFKVLDHLHPSNTTPGQTIGDVHIESGGSFVNAVTGHGDISQNVMLAKKSQNTNKLSRLQKMGKVILELRRSLELIALAAVLITAILTFAKALL